MRGQKIFGMILVLALLVMPSMGDSTPSVATADGQGLGSSLVDLATDGVSGDAALGSSAGGFCTEGGFEITTAGCSFGEIQGAINTARDNGGGTVYLPACDVSLGDRAFLVPGGVKIIGSGKDSTILRDVVFKFSAGYGIVGDGLGRLSSMSILNVFTEKSYYGYFEFLRLPGMRIDHVRFEGKFSSFAIIYLPDHDNGYVLVDHCEFDLFTSYGFYTHGHNTYFDNIYSNDCADILGTANGSGGTVFVEDSTFTGRYDHLMDGRTGVHYVFRHNAITYTMGSGPLEGHGPTEPGPDLDVGTNAIEIYGVTINQTGTPGSAGVLIRSGCGVVYDTTIINKGYGIAMAVETSPYNWPRNAGSYPVYHQPRDLWFWNNTFQDISNGEYVVLWQSEEVIQENRDYFLRAPSQELDGFSYTPYPYPHPMTNELELHGIPANQAIHLDWDVCATLPSTTTWRIDYYTTTLTAPFTATDPLSVTRAYTLTGLTNYQTYTVTLNAMVGTTPILTDTVCVMPTDIFVYLPFMRRE